ncbi:MAG: DUF1800 domain-containing protein [Bacteroidota bacterium]
MTNTNTAATLLGVLDPYVPDAAMPWNAARVQHLYLRLGFGADLARVTAGLALSPAELVDQLIDDIVSQGPPEPPYWGYWSRQDYEDNNDGDEDLYFVHKFELRRRWTSEMITEGLRSKLALFWHNHFVTEEEVYDCNSHMWAYFELLHRRATGNFRQFVEEMGKNPAMLVYLNGNENIAAEPNENYARELMELFTMGEGNGYTQTDIVEVSRALTGWSVGYNCETNVVFNPNEFDDGPKTIFGQTGNWNYDDVHELIFTERALETARYICGKLYRHFVYEKPSQEVIDALALTFMDNDWEIAPVLRQLFKSAHFFSDQFINTRIKSPQEVLVHLFTLLGLEAETDYPTEALDTLTYYAQELGQETFNPVDVAGWPGYHDWLNENTLTFRWSFTASFLYGYFSEYPTVRNKLVNLAIDLSDGVVNDEVLTTRRLVAFVLNQELDERLFETALQYFKGEVPENYFDEDQWNMYFPEAPYQVLNLLFYLTRLPEWQLC